MHQIMHVSSSLLIHSTFFTYKVYFQAQQNAPEWHIRDQLDALHTSINSHTVRHVAVTCKPIRWSPPPSGYLKLNFDGSINQNQAARGAVLQDSEGHLLVDFLKFWYYLSPYC